MLTKVMIAHVDMLSAWMKSQKSGKFKCPRIVIKNLAIHVGLGIDNFKFTLPHFLDEYHKVNDIMMGYRHVYELRFSGRKPNP
jgi:hypothetical protein